MAFPKRIFAARATDFDDGLAVFLSDVHVNGRETYPENGKPIKTCMRECLARHVREILKMDPLPRNVFVFGDLAYHCGRLVDYRRSYPDLRLLTDAGIRLTIGMGNHDHRKAFLEVWPEYAARTLVPGCIHTVTSLPGVDLVMLDSLDEKDEPEVWNPVPGALGASARDWIAARLPQWERPFILCAHHPLNELKLDLGDFPNCRGYVHGHDHVWKTDITSYKDKRGLPMLTLPSNGCWGDIGYVIFRIGGENGCRRAVADLVQKDFYLRAPVAAAERKPAWDRRIEDNRGRRCTFAL